MKQLLLLGLLGLSIGLADLRKPRTAAQQAGTVAATKTRAKDEAKAKADETPAEKKAIHASAVAAGKKGARTRALRVAQAKKLSLQTGRVVKPVTSASLASSARKLRAPENSAAGDWIMAYNDEADTCTAAAIANSLLVCTGRGMDGDDLLTFARATEGYPIYAGLTTLMEMELPYGPRRADSVWPIRTLGLVLGIRMSKGPHAVTVGLHGLITWGAEVQLTDYVVEEAWLIDWPAKERM